MHSHPASQKRHYHPGRLLRSNIKLICAWKEAGKPLNFHLLRSGQIFSWSKVQEHCTAKTQPSEARWLWMRLCLSQKWVQWCCSASNSNSRTFSLFGNIEWALSFSVILSMLLELYYMPQGACITAVAVLLYLDRLSLMISDIWSDYCESFVTHCIDVWFVTSGLYDTEWHKYIVVYGTICVAGYCEDQLPV